MGTSGGITGGGGSGTPFGLRTLLSGRYGMLPGYGRASGPNLAMGLGDCVGVPFTVDAAVTIDRVGLGVATALGAGGLWRAGLYETISASNLLPGALVADFGTIVGDAGTGALEWTGLSQALAAGGKVYLLAVAAQIAGGGALRTTETFNVAMGVLTPANYAGTTAIGAYYRAGVTAAMPDPWGASVIDEVPIRLAIRYA
jgi:hypothetical protein